MFKIYMVDRSNRFAYEEFLDDYFRIRHDIYVGERGWFDLARSDGREIDAFDTRDAIYLLGICPLRGVVAGSRFLPSLKPHLMNDIFPQLAENGVPRGEDIFEWTRIFVVPALRSPGKPSGAAGIVYCGIVEFCLEREIRQLSVVCEPYWLERLEVLGWKPLQLGKSLLHKDGEIIGLLLHMSDEALSITRNAYGITQSVLSSSRPYA
jgi:acyl-homoserine lactone synthase